MLPLQISDTARQNGAARSQCRCRAIALTPTDLADYGRKLERDRRLFGDCVVEVDPLTLAVVR